jgi:hypothetical protein
MIMMTVDGDDIDSDNDNYIQHVSTKLGLSVQAFPLRSLCFPSSFHSPIVIPVLVSTLPFLHYDSLSSHLCISIFYTYLTAILHLSYTYSIIENLINSILHFILHLYLTPIVIISIYLSYTYSHLSYTYLIYTYLTPIAPTPSTPIFYTSLLPTSRIFFTIIPTSGPHVWGPSSDYFSRLPVLYNPNNMSQLLLLLFHKHYRLDRAKVLQFFL